MEGKRGDSGDTGRQSQKSEQEIAVNNRDDGVHPEGPRMTEQHDVKTEENARSKRCKIAPIIVEFKPADEKKAHAADAKDNCHQIAPMEFFTDDERSKYQYVYR